MIRQPGVDEKSGWNQFVAETQQGQIGHLYEWGEVLQQAFGYPLIRLASYENDRISGVCQLAFQKSVLFGKNLISIPFMNVSGILASNPATAQQLYQEALKQADQLKADFMELRHLNPDLHKVPYRGHKVTFVLDLPKTVDELWHNFKDKVRNQIRKSEKEDLMFRLLKEEELEQFYRLYAVNMRNVGTPVLSYQLFLAAQHLLSEKTQLYGVFFKNDLIASGFTMTNQGKMDIPWAASDRKYYSKNLNIFLYWNLMKAAIEQKVTSFDFGRCSKNSGTYRFKKQWGGKEKPLYWYYWAKHPGKISHVTETESFSRRISSQLWKRLPIWAANRLGPLISAKIPA